MRIDTATGVKDIPNTTTWGGAWNGGTVHLNSFDGFCTAANAVDHTVYCVANRANSDSNPTLPSNNLAVLVSYDNGLTWQLFATTGYLGADKRPYGITGAREIRDGHIVGMVTLTGVGEAATNAEQDVVQFFKIPVTTQVTHRLHTVGVTTNAAVVGYPATNAIDANPQTLWTASVSLAPQNNTAFIQIDLGAIKQIDRVRWMSGIGEPFPSYCPANYTISVSDDNENWTTVVTQTERTSGIINGTEPMGGVSGRYIRFATTQVNDGNGWALSFYEFYAEGTALPATRLPATAYGVLTPGYEPAKANDGRYDTQYISSPPDNAAALTLYLGATPRQVARVKWVASVGLPYPAAPPRDFVIQVSNNGINWTTVASRAAAHWTGSTWDGSIPVGVSTQYLRILTSTVFDGTGWSLGLLEFWAEGW